MRCRLEGVLRKRTLAKSEVRTLVHAESAMLAEGLKNKRQARAKTDKLPFALSAFFA